MMHNRNGNVILGFMNDSFGEHFLNTPLHAHINLLYLRGKETVQKIILHAFWLKQHFIWRAK